MINSQSLRIIFFGTTSFAALHLYTLITCSTHKIIAVFTQETQLSQYKSYSLSLHDLTQKYGISLFQSNTLSMSDIIHVITTLNADLIIVVSYGLILPQKILNIPKLGCINVHGSLLPRWRGPAPIQRTLEHGDTITGITIIQMDAGIDTGDILYTELCKISPKDTSYTLSNKLAKIGSTVLLKVLVQLVSNTSIRTPQNSVNATYAYKLNKKEARINWALSAIQIERNIRAFNPWPISYFTIKNNHRIRVWDSTISNTHIINDTSSISPGTILKIDTHGIHVITGSGVLILTMLQISGKKKTPAIDILNAYKEWFIPNSILN